MGRPIKKLFIGNRNSTGIGGEGVASTTITGAGTGYTTGEAVTFSAPQLPGGTTATGTVVVTAGAVDSITITNAGSGYTSAPTVDLSGEGNGDATATATLTTGTQNAIAISAYVPGGSSAVAGDIVAQKGSKTYRVTTAQGTGECVLVAAAIPTEGQMNITATDSAGDTYYVKKLTNRTVVLLRATGTEFETDAKVKWGDTAILNTQVSITN
jgi:hypothetical protein